MPSTESGPGRRRAAPANTNKRPRWASLAWFLWRDGLSCAQVASQLRREGHRRVTAPQVERLVSELAGEELLAWVERRRGW